MRRLSAILIIGAILGSMFTILGYSLSTNLPSTRHFSQEGLDIAAMTTFKAHLANKIPTESDFSNFANSLYDRVPGLNQKTNPFHNLNSFSEQLGLHEFFYGFNNPDSQHQVTVCVRLPMTLKEYPTLVKCDPFFGPPASITN